MCLSVLGHAAARAAHGADPTPTPATESPQQWACTWARSASASSSRRWSARARARAMSSGTGGRAGGTGRRADRRADGPRDGRSHATHIDCGTLQDIAMLARAGVRHGTRACSAGEGCQVRGRLLPRSASVGTCGADAHLMRPESRRPSQTAPMLTHTYITHARLQNVRAGGRGAGQRPGHGAPRVGRLQRARAVHRCVRQPTQREARRLGRRGGDCHDGASGDAGAAVSLVRMRLKRRRKTPKQQQLLAIRDAA